MTAIRWFTDEDFYAAVAVSLRKAGHDALSTAEAKRLGELDDAQLEFATQSNRVIVTFNIVDFARLHSQWLMRGEYHAGIAVSSQSSVGDVVKRLLKLSAALSAEDMRDRIEYLSNW